MAFFLCTVEPAIALGYFVLGSSETNCKEEALWRSKTKNKNK